MATTEEFKEELVLRRLRVRPAGVLWASSRNVGVESDMCGTSPVLILAVLFRYGVFFSLSLSLFLSLPRTLRLIDYYHFLISNLLLYFSVPLLTRSD